MGLADRLLADFSSDDDEPLLDQNEDRDLVDGDNQEDVKLINPVDDGDDTHKKDFNYLIIREDLQGIESVTGYSIVLPKAKSLLKKLDEIKASGSDFQDKEVENQFLSNANQTLDNIRSEITSIFSFVKIYYKPFWPDLDDLIKNPIDFAKVVKLVHDNVSLVSSNSSMLEKILKKEEILGLTMSASLVSQLAKPHIDPIYLKLVLEACDILLELESIRISIRTYVTERALIIAPNVTAIVGPSTGAQLISNYGLDNLCKTPSCNLPSIGVNNSNAVKGNNVGIRNKGYLYYCDLVQGVDDEYKVQAMRMISGKVILASRIDYSQREKTTIDDSNGVKWREEIASKLDKLQIPPDQAKVKPMAKPIDQKSKKRGGKRFRKQKERMEMSDLAKAQNKMAFGRQEETKMDVFGDEIGLGMVGKFSTGGSYRALAASESKRAQMTKSTVNKLQKFTGNNNNNSGGSKLLKSLDIDDRLLKFQEGSSGLEKKGANQRTWGKQIHDKKRLIAADLPGTKRKRLE